ncbi:MAG: HNH endonuclease, partial [Propionibacteriales bacterium]|nr:HNH endonuclease [Propionibacteriales bacterium]
MIAQRPESTWHRMLTDPAGSMVELSTTSYQPTASIWSWVVADYGSCFRSGCDIPATEAELDHRVRWPEGATDTDNVWPGCKSDHKAKHAAGFAIEQTADGSYALRTPTGFLHPIERTEHPASDRFDLPTPDRDDGFQFSATELAEAISYLREVDEDQRPVDLAHMWEIGCEDALADVLDQIYSVA